MEPEKKKIIIVEDNDLFRSSLKRLVNSQDDLEVVAEAVDGKQALEIIERQPADLVLLDLRLPKLSGYEILREISGNPSLKIMVLTALESNQSIRSALEAGADGYCFKDVGRNELLGAIAAVLSGVRYISRTELDYPDEKRMEHRPSCDCTIQWDYFNRSEFASGRLINCSRYGCLFDTGKAVIDGSTISIRLEHCVREAHEKLPSCLRSSAVAEVKWCLKKGNRYLVGTRYHFPV
jgi:CheY-like chemotaxis protein